MKNRVLILPEGDKEMWQLEGTLTGQLRYVNNDIFEYIFFMDLTSTSAAIVSLAASAIIVSRRRFSNLRAREWLWYVSLSSGIWTIVGRAWSVYSCADTVTCNKNNANSRPDKAMSYFSRRTEQWSLFNWIFNWIL